MSDEPHSDEEIIAQEKRRYRRRIIEGLLFWIVVTATIVGAFALTSDTTLEGATSNYLKFLPLLLIPACALFLWRHRSLKAERQDGVRRKLIDVKQGRQRRLMLMMLFIVGMLAYNQPNLTHPVRPSAAIFAAVIFLVALTFSGFWFRGVDNPQDELTIAFRAYATRAGFAGVMGILGIVYLLTIFRPDLIEPLLPWLIFAGIAIPTIVFLFLDWKASRS